MIRISDLDLIHHLLLNKLLFNLEELSQKILYSQIKIEIYVVVVSQYVFQLWKNLSQNP